MVRGIEHGDNFDPVPVLRLDDRTYALVPDVKNSEGITDGGHHRAAAHYVTNQPLPIRILEPALQSNRFRDCKTGADMVRVLTSQPPPDGQRYTYHDPEDLRNGMTVDKMILRQDDLCAYQYHRLTDPRVR